MQTFSESFSNCFYKFKSFRKRRNGFRRLSNHDRRMLAENLVDLLAQLVERLLIKYPARLDFRVLLELLKCFLSFRPEYPVHAGFADVIPQIEQLLLELLDLVALSTLLKLTPERTQRIVVARDRLCKLINDRLRLVIAEGFLDPIAKILNPVRNFHQVVGGRLRKYLGPSVLDRVQQIVERLEH